MTISQLNGKGNAREIAKHGPSPYLSDVRAPPADDDLAVRLRGRPRRQEGAGHGSFVVIPNPPFRSSVYRFARDESWLGGGCWACGVLLEDVGCASDGGFQRASCCGGLGGRRRERLRRACWAQATGRRGFEVLPEVSDGRESEAVALRLASGVGVANAFCVKAAVALHVGQGSSDAPLDRLPPGGSCPVERPLLLHRVPGRPLARDGRLGCELPELILATDGAQELELLSGRSH